MNETTSNSLYDRIYRMAQFQTQIAIAILPIGAGVAGFISQQPLTFPILAALGLVWLGLAAITVSIIFSLKVIRTEPGNYDKRKKMERDYGIAIFTFIVGIFFLIISPFGFPLNKYVTPSQIEMKPSSEIYRVSYSQDNSPNLTVVIYSKDIPSQEYRSLQIKPEASESACLFVTKLNDLPPEYTHDTWLTIWSVSMSPSCAYGDYVILFKLWQGRNLRGQTSVVIKIDK